MYARTSHAQSDPDPARPLRRAFNGLIDFGRDLLERLAGARQFGVTRYIPKRMAKDIPTAEARTHRALTWVWALVDLCQGGRTYLPPAGVPAPTARRPAAATGARRGEPTPSLNPCWTDLDNEQALTRKIQRTFATVPMNVIAQGLARRLGIRADSDFFPRELLEITETPLAWATRVHTQAPPPPEVAFPPHALPHPPGSQPPDVEPPLRTVHPVSRDPPLSGPSG